MNLQFEFLNFKPETEIKSFVAHIGEKLQMTSPSDSVITVALSKGKDLMQASCRIASKAGIFVADSVSECPINAIQKIESQIMGQLNSWKQTRFL